MQIKITIYVQPFPVCPWGLRLSLCSGCRLFAFAVIAAAWGGKGGEGVAVGLRQEIRAVAPEGRAAVLSPAHHVLLQSVG